MKVLEWGVYLIVFCLPLYLIRFKIFNIPTTVLELMIYVLFVFWLFKAKYRGIKDVIVRIQEIILPIMFILVGVSAATIFSWDLRVSLGIWKAWFVDPILFFIVIVSIIKNIEQIKKVFYSLIFSGFVISIISLIYLISGKLDEQGRLQGIYTSPNYLAMYLAPVLIICFGYCFLAFFVRPSEANSGLSPSLSLRTPLGNPARFGLKTRLKTIPQNTLLIFSFFLVLILFFTKSFGAWIGVLTALVFGLIIYLFKIKNKKIIFGIIFLGLAIILIFAFLKINSIQGRLSLNSRLEIWQKAWQVFKTYPVFGIGPGTFQDYFPSYPKWGVPQPHNLYLAFLLQTGILGFIGFAWLLAWFFRGGFKLLNTRYSLLITVLLSSMVYILVHGLVDTTYWKNDLSIIFWLLIGLMAGFKKEPQ